MNDQPNSLGVVPLLQCVVGSILLAVPVLFVLYIVALIVLPPKWYGAQP